jgi:hypothetical protein
MSNCHPSAASWRRFGALAVLALVAIPWVSGVARGEALLSLSGGFAPAFQYAGELKAGSGAGFGLDATLTIMPVPRWEFGLQSGIWRWNGHDECSPKNRDDCGYESLTCISRCSVWALGEARSSLYLMSRRSIWRLS